MAVGRRAPSKQASATLANVTLDGMNRIDSFTESRRRSLGVVVDPEDPDFILSYEVLGAPVLCQVVFHAALNAIATLAVMDNEHRCTHFAGFSSMGEETYTIHSNPPGTSPLVLNYMLVRGALKVLPARLCEEESCVETPNLPLIMAASRLELVLFVSLIFQVRDT